MRTAMLEQTCRDIDIISDKEQTHQHFVTIFIEHLSGVDFDNKQIVLIRNRYKASVPSVAGAVERKAPCS